MLCGTYPIGTSNGYSKVVYYISKYLGIYEDIELTVYGFQNFANTSGANTAIGTNAMATNTTGTNSSLYNRTYYKVIDDRSSTNVDPTRNFVESRHVTGTNYTDLFVTCLLDYGEPAGQAAFDNGTQNQSSFVFDELGILADYGVDSRGFEQTKLLTHVIFHPVQKSLNRQIQIDYTIRIQSLTNLVTV